jgi:PAS domain S-box-containing protein
MNASSFFKPTGPFTRNRLGIIALLTAVALAANLFGLIAGITVVFSHFFYLPVILAAYWYPRRGILFSACMAIAYGVMVFLAIPPDFQFMVTVVSRMAFFVVIGGVVSVLSSRLRRSEQELFDIIEFLPDATFAVNREGAVIAWNRAIEEMTGIKKSEMLGRGNYEYAIPFCRKRRPVLVDLLREEIRVTEAEYPGVRKESDKLVCEVFIPHFHEGRGAHLRFSAKALVDAEGTMTGAIESIRDVTDRVMTETALRNTSSRLNILAGIVRHDLAKKLSVLYVHLAEGMTKFTSPDVLSFIAAVRESANGIRRQIEISREFRDIGTTPPAWVPVQRAVSEAALRLVFTNVPVRAWTERLEVFADPHIPTVFYHILHNSLKETTGATKVVVTYQIRDDGCAVIIEDNGSGIPDQNKAALFSQWDDSYGHGLFLAHEILAITGMDIRETGIPGKGARFEILVPSEGYRII